MVNEEHVSVSEEAGTAKMLTMSRVPIYRRRRCGAGPSRRWKGAGSFTCPEAASSYPSESERDLGHCEDPDPQPDVEDGRPTIIFDPARGRIKKYHYAQVRGKMMRAQVKDTARPDLQAIMSRYGEWTESVILQLFPSYQGKLDRKRITYRPFARSNTQSLHIDSSYGYPTQGRSMLRIFTNIHPVSRPRIWQLGEPFEPFVRRSCLPCT